MRKIEDLFETYYREVGFVVLMSVMTVCLIFSANKAPVDSSVYSLWGLFVLTVLFCGDTLLLGFNASASGEAERLKFFTALGALAVFGTLFAYSYYLRGVLTPVDTIEIAVFAIICAFVCGWFWDVRIAKLKHWEELSENRPDLYLREMIKEKRVLREHEQLRVFELYDAEQLFYQFMQYDELEGAAEIRMIEQPYLLRLLKMLPSYAFSDAAVARMFVQPNAPALVMRYVENRNAFNPANELRMFDLPNAEEVVKCYAKNNVLSAPACAIAKEKGWI